MFCGCWVHLDCEDSIGIDLVVGDVSLPAHLCIVSMQEIDSSCSPFRPLAGIVSNVCWTMTCNDADVIDCFLDMAMDHCAHRPCDERE